MINPFFMQQLYVTHKSLTGQGTNRGLSPRIWDRLAGGSISVDSQLSGYFAGDDFNCFGDTYAVASNVGRYAGEMGAYRSYEDTGNAITQLVNKNGGVLSVATDATDNDESWIQPGQATSVIGKIDKAAKCLTLFEARIAVSQITNTFGLMCAMSEEALAAADTFADAGTIADKDFIGFWALEGAAATLKYGWNKAGAGGITTLGTAATLVADTFVKIGWAYDPSAHIDPRNRLTFYVNNVELTVYGTDTLLEGATFPDAQYLNWLFGLKNGTASANTITCDWWAFYQRHAF